MNKLLFRRDVLRNDCVKIQGRIVLIRPISFLFIVIGVIGVLLFVILFGIFGNYTQRSTLNGQLNPDFGVLKIYAPQVGTILEKHVTEGQSVKAGDVLYVLTSDRRSSVKGDMQAIVSQQVKLRRQSLNEAIEQTRQLAKVDKDAASKKLSGLQAEYVKVDESLNGIRARVALAEHAQARYENLLKQGYMSQDEVLTRQTDLLDQRSRLQTLERDRISLQRQLDEQQSTLRELPIRYQNQIAELERSVTSTEQELTQSEAVRQWVVTAPQDGVTSAVIGEVGQSVDASRPLLSLVPKGATLQAQLYAPSRAVGFVKLGDQVYLRYQAYPYQKFGHHEGVVVAVSHTATSTSDLTGTNASYTSASNEPVYQITVKLASQSITTYGKSQLLQAGMAVEADVLQETRHLYEWVLEPLMTLSGKMH